MKSYITSIALALFCVSLLSQNTGYDDSWNEIQSDNGVCYAEAYETDLYEYEEQEYFVYTGQEHNIHKKYLTTVSHLVMDAPLSNWAKINYGTTDCLSADPMDCLSMRRRNNTYGIRYRTSAVVTDTSQVKDFDKRILTTARLVESRSGIKKVRVLCRNELTSAKRKKIHETLVEAGFLHSDFRASNNKRIKEALYRYQVHYGLPLGYLDFETLAHLKIL